MNSDLELAGTIIHQSILGASDDLQGEMIHTHYDTSPQLPGMNGALLQ